MDRAMIAPYAPPVAQLLTFERSEDFAFDWPDYPDLLGIAADDVPELIRMATDLELHRAPADLCWAPVHAWRALAQLEASEAIEPLTSLLHTLEDDDFTGHELPRVFAKLGTSAIGPLSRYLAIEEHGLFPRAYAADALREVGAASAGRRTAGRCPVRTSAERFDACERDNEEEAEGETTNGESLETAESAAQIMDSIARARPRDANRCQLCRWIVFTQ